MVAGRGIMGDATLIGRITEGERGGVAICLAAGCDYQMLLCSSLGLSVPASRMWNELSNECECRGGRVFVKSGNRRLCAAHVQCLSA